jgi:DNA-binding transcriptional MerR regulator
MTKPLTQITFEFSHAEKEEIISAPVAEETVTKKEIQPVIEVSKKQPPIPATGKRGRRSLKEIGIAADLIQVPDDEILFQKQYYSIGEVAAMFRENQSLIRYWETEFDILEPKKNKKGDRFFRPVDVKNLVLIHDLLRRRKFTIEGAKEFLKKYNAKHPEGRAQEKFLMIQSLENLKTFLNELKASL